MIRRSLLGAGLTVSALSVAACGTSAGPAAVIQQATQSRSPQRCDLYTDAFFQQAGTSAAAGRAYCRQLAPKLAPAHITITSTVVRGDHAMVTAVASGRTVVYRLLKRGGHWLIDGLGA